jgi:membrane-bound inhibitor of C-type lysozyme
MSVAVGASLLLAACAADGTGDSRKAVDAFFLCGKDVVHTRFEPERMTLTRGVTRYVLERARSGSGARYTGESPNGPVEFWNKGRKATLKIGNHLFPECRQQGSAH